MSGVERMVEPQRMRFSPGRFEDYLMSGYNGRTFSQAVQPHGQLESSIPSHRFHGGMVREQFTAAKSSFALVRSCLTYAIVVAIGNVAIAEQFRTAAGTEPQPVVQFVQDLVLANDHSVQPAAPQIVDRQPRLFRAKLVSNLILVPAQRNELARDEQLAPKEPPAPIEELLAPAVEPSAPTEELLAPTEELLAPAVEPSAPAVESPAPAVESPAPTVEPPAPAEELLAPAEELPAPSGRSVDRSTEQPTPFLAPAIPGQDVVFESAPKEFGGFEESEELMGHAEQTPRQWLDIRPQPVDKDIHSDQLADDARELPPLPEIPKLIQFYSFDLHRADFCESATFCHNPLYFEDRLLERKGVSRGVFGCVPAIRSGIHFLARAATLPYHMLHDRPCSCVRSDCICK